jgi:hypothetical protein
MTARIGLFNLQILLGLLLSVDFLLPPRHARPRTVGRTVSGLIVLARHPRPDVRGTIAKDNTSSGVVLSQETDGVTIGEDQIRQIENRDAVSRLGVDQLAQFADAVRVKLTADREHNRSAARAMNSQHRPCCSERNC